MDNSRNSPNFPPPDFPSIQYVAIAGKQITEITV